MGYGINASYSDSIHAGEPHSHDRPQADVPTASTGGYNRATTTSPATTKFPATTTSPATDRVCCRPAG